MLKVKITYSTDIRRMDEKRKNLVQEVTNHILEQIKPQFQYPLEICNFSSTLEINEIKKSKSFLRSNEKKTVFWIHADFKPKEKQTLKCGLSEKYFNLKGEILKELNTLVKKINVNKIDLFIFPGHL